MFIFRTLLQKLGFQRRGESLRFNQDVVDAVRILSDQEGRPFEEFATDLVLSQIHHRRKQDAHYQAWESLTPRQQEVAALICLRYTNPQIAQRLTISTETVRDHARAALAKFQVANRAELQTLLSDWDFSRWQG